VSIIKAYQLSLSLPLLVPAALAPILFGLVGVLPEWLITVLSFVVWSGLIGGVPYVLLATLLLLWARGKREKEIRRGLILSPFFMLLIFWCFVTVASLISPSPDASPSSLAQAFLFFGSFVLIFGYAYVALVFGAIWMLRRKRLLTYPPPTT
jgi:MFS family permease